jgi:hypothetical protein
LIITTDDIVKRAQLSADMHDGPFTPTQWMYWATLENIALSIFLARTGWTKNVKTQTITVTGAEAGAFVLTQAPLAIVAIHQVRSDGTVRRIRTNNAIDFLHQTVSSTRIHGDPAEFRVIWDQDNDQYQVNFFPQPDAGSQFLVSYIPHPLKLVIGSPGAGEANSVTYPLGFEEWIVLKLAIRAQKTTGEDPSSLLQEFASTQSMIEQAVWDAVFSDAKVRNVDTVERGLHWTRGVVYPPNTEWWFI